MQSTYQCTVHFQVIAVPFYHCSYCCAVHASAIVACLTVTLSEWAAHYSNFANLCDAILTTQMVQEEEEMDVQDAAEEIARGSLPPSVLGQAAALPLPPSRLSVFLDPGRPHGTPSSPPTGSRTQSRLHAHSPVPDNSLLEDSTSFTEIVMLDRSNSMMLPTSSQSQRQSSRATGSHTQSALSTCPGPSQPDVVIRPSTAKSWRVAYVSGQRSKYMQGCEFPIHMVYVLTSNRPTWI